MHCIHCKRRYPTWDDATHCDCEPSQLAEPELKYVVLVENDLGNTVVHSEWTNKSDAEDQADLVHGKCFLVRKSKQEDFT